MSDQLLLWSEPRARHSDGETSRDAADKVRASHKGRLDAIAQLVEMWRDVGLTADEVHFYMPGVLRSTVHGAVSACAKAGLIVPTSVTRPSISGTPMRVYVHPKWA